MSRHNVPELKGIIDFMNLTRRLCECYAFNNLGKVSIKCIRDDLDGGLWRVVQQNLVRHIEEEVFERCK